MSAKVQVSDKEYIPVLLKQYGFRTVVQARDPKTRLLHDVRQNKTAVILISVHLYEAELSESKSFMIPIHFMLIWVK